MQRGLLGGIRECCHSVFSCSVKYLGLPLCQENRTVMETDSHGGCYMTDKARQSVTNSFRHSRLRPQRNTEQSWSLPKREGRDCSSPHVNEHGWAELGQQANTPFSACLEHAGYQNSWGEIKGTVSRDFLFFFIYFIFPRPLIIPLEPFNFYLICKDICNPRCTTVSVVFLALVANLPPM
jgi:hypothetical protein